MRLSRDNGDYVITQPGVSFRAPTIDGFTSRIKNINNLPTRFFFMDSKKKTCCGGCLIVLIAIVIVSFPLSPMIYTMGYYHSYRGYSEDYDPGSIEGRAVVPGLPTWLSELDEWLTFTIEGENATLILTTGDQTYTRTGAWNSTFFFDYPSDIYSVYNSHYAIYLERPEDIEFRTLAFLLPFIAIALVVVVCATCLTKDKEYPPVMSKKYREKFGLNKGQPTDSPKD
jgi:hypothetical protein